MNSVKRYRATIGNGSTQRRVWVYLCADVESPKHEKLFKAVSANAVDVLTSAQAELAALREELAETQRISQQEELRANEYATKLVAAEQRNSDQHAKHYSRLLGAVALILRARDAIASDPSCAWKVLNEVASEVHPTTEDVKRLMIVMPTKLDLSWPSDKTTESGAG